MAVKDKKQRQPHTFLAFVLYHLLLASLSSNNPKQSCSQGGLVSEETGLQYVLFESVKYLIWDLNAIGCYLFREAGKYLDQFYFLCSSC